MPRGRSTCEGRNALEGRCTFEELPQVDRGDFGGNISSLLFILTGETTYTSSAARLPCSFNANFLLPALAYMSIARFVAAAYS
jgi:hypothetical protein